MILACAREIYFSTLFVYMANLFRREFLQATATLGAAVAGGVLLGPGSERSEEAIQVMPSRLDPLRPLALERRLAINREEVDRLWKGNAQEYMLDRRRLGHRLLTEGSPDEEQLECVHELLEDDVTNCLAGLGVH